jgi:hypothetical protein
MRAALGGAALSGSMLLSVGSDEVAVTTPETSVTERKVALPDRWVKGFGEVQALARSMRLAGELQGPEAPRFIRTIPGNARQPLWVFQDARGFSLTTTPRAGAVCLAGPHRLAELKPLLRFARRLRIYGPPASAGSMPMPSAWELDFGTARLTLTLSPERYRGFSGEGALLDTLSDSQTAADADLVSVLLAWDPQVDVGRLSAEADLTPERVTAALGWLAATGQVGFDLAEESFFHRELPFSTSIASMHPRLADAKDLVAARSVTMTATGALVRSGDSEHRVTFAHSEDKCTCPWWGKHRGTRGPCKHVLAARMAAS